MCRWKLFNWIPQKRPDQVKQKQFWLSKVKKGYLIPNYAIGRLTRQKIDWQKKAQLNFIQLDTPVPALLT